MTGACAFGDTLFAVTGHVDDLTPQRDLLGGRAQRRSGDQQCGDQQSQGSLHPQTSSANLHQLYRQGVFAEAVTLMVTSAGVERMPSSAYARITYVPGSVNTTCVVVLPSLTTMVIGSNVSLPGPRQWVHVTASPCRLGFTIA